MQRISKLAALTILGVIAVNPVYAEDKSAATVTITIPQQRVDLRVKAVAAQGQPDTPELRKAIREDLINIELISQEAVKQNLDKQPETVQLLELSRQQVLVGAFVQDYVKTHPVAEKEITEAYESLKNNLGSKEYNARHILVETENEAKAIIAQLGKKAKFEKLAEKSKDTGSAGQGGSLGWAAPSSFVPSFASALTNLKKGEYTKAPVQSQFGWHVIKLEDVRDLKLPPFEELKPQLAQRMQQQAVQNMIAELRAKAKVE